MEECNKKDWNDCKIFDIIIPCSVACFLEVGARLLLKVTTKDFLEVKNLLKLRFLDYFSKAETEECNQEVWSVFDKTG